MAERKKPKPPGPEPEHLQLDGDWGENLRKALEKKRPPDGWPKPKKKGRE